MKDLKLNLIVAALDRATAPLRRVGAALGHLKEGTEKLHHAMHKLGMAEFIGTAFITGAAVEAGHAILELTDHVAEMGERALISSQQVNTNIETMQRWAWVAKQVGVEAGGVEHAFAMMELHAGNAIKGNKASADALRLVGVSMKDVRRLSRDPGALFARIVEGYQSLKNPAAKAVAAQGIFSRSWQEMAPLLSAPREEIAELMDQLDKAHVVMSSEDAEAAHKYIQAKQNMGLAASGLGKRIGQELIPRLTQAFDKITAWIESLSDDAVNKFADAVGKLADRFVQMLPHLENLVMGALDLTDKLLRLCDNTNAVKGAFMALAGFLAVQGIVALVEVGAQIGSIGWASLRAAGLIWSLIPAITAATDAQALWDLAMDANPIGLIALVIEAAIVVIGAFAFAIYELVKHWDDLWHGIEDGCRKIEKAFSDLEAKMPKWLLKLLNAGGAVLAMQFPALGALGAAVDGLAHAPSPKATPGKAQPTADQAVPNLASLEKLNAAIEAAKQKTPPGGKPAAGAAPAGPLSRIPPPQQPFADKRRSASDVIGTIVIKTEPGTSVSRATSSDGLAFRFNRGQLPA